jgi:hypothetical protein
MNDNYAIIKKYKTPELAEYEIQVLASVATGEFDIELQQLFERYCKINPDETPVLIGYLNKQQGFQGYDPLPVGTPVFEFKDRYQIERTITKTGEKNWVRYYKESLKPIIDFI